MELIEIKDVMSLFTPGLIAGAGIGSLAWIIGYAVSAVYNLIKKQ